LWVHKYSYSNWSLTFSRFAMWSASTSALFWPV
jgi:hypothetical protein